MVPVRSSRPNQLCQHQLEINLIRISAIRISAGRRFCPTAVIRHRENDVFAQFSNAFSLASLALPLILVPRSSTCSGGREFSPAAVLQVHLLKR